MDLIQCITAAGILEFDAGFQSDHRAMFLDLDIRKFFCGLSDDPVSPKLHAFTTANYKQFTKVKTYIKSEWKRRNLKVRLEQIIKISHLPPLSIWKERLLSMWEGLDCDRGKIFSGAKASLNTPRKTRYMWSPALALAGKTKRHWRSWWANAAAGISGTHILIKRDKDGMAIIDDGCMETQ